MSDKSDTEQAFLIQKLQAYAGLVFIAMAVVSFGAAVYFVVISGITTNFDGRPDLSAEPVFLKMLRQNSEAAFLILGAALGSFLGASLLGSALHATKPTISPEDRELLNPLIEAANEDAVSQYVRISSLTGQTGFFTKLGFTGLPLVTAGLGILLIFLALLAPVSSEHNIKTELMDLAKLVIGAFIGSFVQRRVERSNTQDKTRPENLL